MSYFQPKKPKNQTNRDYYLPAWTPKDFDPDCREPGCDDEEIESDNVAWEFEPDLELCREVECFIAACTNNVRKKGANQMNVAAFNTNNGGEKLPFLDAKAVGAKGATGKILAARAVKTPKFNGLFLDIKLGGKKYSYGVSFDRFDLGAIVAQVGSDETDDWLGESIKFVSKKGKKKGQVFVNVAYPKTKAKR